MTTDFNNHQIITKGTLVRVITTNGGEIIAPLSSNHYPTYDVALEGFVIPSYRTISVQIIA